MQQVLFRLRGEAQYHEFDVLKINLEHLKMTRDVNRVVQVIAEEIVASQELQVVAVTELDEFYNVFLWKL